MLLRRSESVRLALTLEKKESLENRKAFTCEQKEGELETGGAQISQSGSSTEAFLTHRSAAFSQTVQAAQSRAARPEGAKRVRPTSGPHG